MIARRREMRTLDALDELIQHLRGVREERKAVITMTDGWPLYEPDRNLAKPLIDPKPTASITGGQTQVPVPKIGRDPQNRAHHAERSGARHDDLERRRLEYRPREV